MRECDVLVVGGGPAGITFSRKLKKLKPETDIVMLRPEKYSMVYCAIPYAIEGLFEPSKVYKKDALVTDAGVELVRRAAREVDLREKRVVDDAGDEYRADILFLATGASPVRPPIPGAESRNVHTVKTQSDMEALIRSLDGGAKRAVVVGAGAIGIEQAQAYRTRDIDTRLVDMAGSALPNMLDPDMAEPVHDALREKGVELRFGSKIETIATVGDAASGVTFTGGESIELDPERDFVVFSIGMRPDTALFEGQGLETTDDGIVVDNRMRTSIPDVYAAGDCCAGISAIDNRPIAGRLATNAVPMAKIAARVVAGKDDEYPGFYNGAATCAFDLRVGSTGFTADAAERRGMETVCGYGETTTLFPMMPGAGNLKVKIVADKRDLRIIGGQVVSTLPVTDKVDVITLAVQRRMTLKGLARLSYSAQPWQSFFPARSAVVEACENALDNFAALGESFHYPELLECV